MVICLFLVSQLHVSIIYRCLVIYLHIRSGLAIEYTVLG